MGPVTDLDATKSVLVKRSEPCRIGPIDRSEACGLGPNDRRDYNVDRKPEAGVTFNDQKPWP
jgi:hypothetical protein